MRPTKPKLDFQLLKLFIGLEEIMSDQISAKCGGLPVPATKPPLIIINSSIIANIEVIVKNNLYRQPPPHRE